MDNFDVIEYEFSLEHYQLEPFGIDDLTSIYCTLFVDEEYIVDGDFMPELNRKDNQAIERLLDKEIRTVIKSLDQQENLRNLIVLDKIALVIEEALLAYCKKNPYIQVVKISFDDFVTTYSNPELLDVLSELYEESKSEFMDMMDFDDEGDLEDFFMNNLDLLGNGLHGFDFEDDDDEPDNDNKILRFPDDGLPF